MTQRWMRWVLVGAVLVAGGRPGATLVQQVCLRLTTPAFAAAGAVPAPLPLERIKLPPGFSIALYASGVTAARHMALSPSGTVFVGGFRLGAPAKYDVHALVDRNRDGKADEVIAVLKGLDSPNGVAFRDGALYVAEMHRILRYDDIEAHLASPPEPKVIIDNLPGTAQHGWKTIAFGPDGKLYVTIGAPCNVCDMRAEDARLGTIARMNPDGTGFEVVALGVRNSVGLAWHPLTKELWFTSNGRDMLGDDTPPDTLNRETKVGQDFGFPFCHAGDISDPQFGAKYPCRGFVPPARKLGAHVAALGMTFYTSRMFPVEYRGAAFIAEHGSWNRSRKSGYRVTVVYLDAASKAIKYEPFAEGWLEGEANWGRPVALLVMADGALLVSDEQANAVYRISYRKP